jgi:hypothetical protein
MRHSRNRDAVLTSTFSALVAVMCAGCGGPPPSQPPPSNPVPILFVGSVFTQCTSYVNRYGTPGRSLQQQEFQISSTMIGACPEYIVLSKPAIVFPMHWIDPSDSQSMAAILYLSSRTPTDCTFVNPQLTSSNSVACKLALTVEGTSPTPDSR